MTRRNGYTLFEVLISLAIFMLLAGGIFATVQSAVQASAQLTTAQLEESRNSAFERFCRNLFRNLPGDARLELRVQPWEGRGNSIELLIWPAPPGLDSAIGMKDGLVLGALPDAAGNFQISLAGFAHDLSVGARDRALQEAVWVPLLPNLKHLRWRFIPQSDSKYVEGWTPEDGRPALAELELLRSDGSHKTFQFQIPNVAPLKQFGGSP